MGLFSASFTASAPAWNSKRADVSGAWKISQPSTGTLQAPVSRAQVRLTRGRGDMTLNLSAEGLQADATAELDLPARQLKGIFQCALKNFQGLAEWAPALKEAQGHARRPDGTLDGSWPHFSIKAQALAQKLRYRNTLLDEAHGQLAGHLGVGRELTLDGSIRGLALNAPDETPWDVLASEVHLQGKNPRWEAKTKIAFRNKLTFNYAGEIEKQPRAWRLAWQTLTLEPPAGAALRNTQPGEALVSRAGTWTIKNLQLSSGKGTLQMPVGVFKKGDGRYRMLCDGYAARVFRRVV